MASSRASSDAAARREQSLLNDLSTVANTTHATVGIDMLDATDAWQRLKAAIHRIAALEALARYVAGLPSTDMDCIECGMFERSGEHAPGCHVALARALLNKDGGA